MPEERQVTVSLRLRLTPAQLVKLGQGLHGKAKRATRAEVAGWVERMVEQALASGRPDAPVRELESHICPKCGKVIALRTGRSRAPEAASSKASPVAAKDAKDAAAALRRAADALDKLAGGA